jgi:hypothetical protein
MNTLHQLIAEAALLGGTNLCAAGHEWKSTGGRGCACFSHNHSQPTYECVRCGEVDYGDRGGPGYEDCTRHCGNRGPEHYRWRI